MGDRNSDNSLGDSQMSCPTFGALVISLDFELHWGVRDSKSASGSYRKNLLGARDAIPYILDLFERYEIAATWATVGFLFATSRDELESFSPQVRPNYYNNLLCPYKEPIGADEDDDPLHFAPSLITQIAKRARQEIGTHTFSHYYCLEPGQTRETFKADLDSACAIAKKHNITLRSIVFPRNQFNPSYTDILLDAGITTYRGNEQGWMYRASTTRKSRNYLYRIARLFDRYTHLVNPALTSWNKVVQSNRLCNVPASHFLSPYTPRLKRIEQLRIARIIHDIQAAARSKTIFHLWWHPHNFGLHISENIAALKQILEAFARVRATHDMRSYTMSDVAAISKEFATVPNHTLSVES
jgi:peptidoglycan/xylan/chitin deacetylase (PgdA/CDA1 family)